MTHFQGVSLVLGCLFGGGGESAAITVGAANQFRDRAELRAPQFKTSRNNRQRLFPGSASGLGNSSSQ